MQPDARAAAQPRPRSQREPDDLQLVLRAKNGDGWALDALMKRYSTFVRLRASSYFSSRAGTPRTSSRRA